MSTVLARRSTATRAKFAHERPGQTLQATALVHEAYVRLVDQTDPQAWDSARHFFSAAAEALRRILIERASLKRGGDHERIERKLSSRPKASRYAWSLPGRRPGANRRRPTPESFNFGDQKLSQRRRFCAGGFETLIRATQASGQEQSQMNMAHIHADDQGNWRSRYSMSNDAHYHAKTGEPYYGADNLAMLRIVLQRLAEKKARLKKLDFHTHGAPGLLAIGSDILTRRTLNQFRSLRFDRILAKGARIFFHGCNVAETAVGELFVAEFAALFLKQVGGRVGGSTTVGLRDAWFNSGKSYHLPNTTVSAKVRPGGLIELTHQSPPQLHLRLEHVQEHLDFLEKDAVPVLESGGSSLLLHAKKIADAKAYVRKAKKFLKLMRGGDIQAIRNLYNAHYMVLRTGKIVAEMFHASRTMTQIKLLKRLQREMLKLTPYHTWSNWSAHGI